jgi:hypothetical protein
VEGADPGPAMQLPQPHAHTAGSSSSPLALPLVLDRLQGQRISLSSSVPRQMCLTWTTRAAAQTSRLPTSSRAPPAASAARLAATMPGLVRELRAAATPSGRSWASSDTNSEGRTQRHTWS